MRERLLLVFFGIILSITICAENPGTKPTYFTENRGQFRDQNGDANSDVLYIADFGGFKVQLRKNGFSYETYQVKPQWVDPATIPYKILTLTENGDTIVTRPGQQEAMRNQIYHFHRIDVDFIGSNKSAIINTGRQGQKSKKILFPEKNGETATVHTYESISIIDVYPGIDIVYYAQNESGEFKYDFIVHPGADVSAIGLEYKSSGSIYLDETGKLNLDTRFGLITESIPLCYTENTKGERTIIEDVQFRLQDNMVYFQGTDLVINEKLIIDPAVNLYWAVFFGGEGRDESSSIEVDGLGHTYLCGKTRSAENIATVGVFQDSLLMEEDGFLAKFSRTGELQWSTYLNASPAVDIDYKNDLVVLTWDRIMKFDTAGNFIWQISSMNGLKAIIQDNDENIIAVGDSLLLYPSGSVIYHNDTIIKYNSQGVLQWSRGYGGSETYINDVGVDGLGNIYIVGITKDSLGIATPGSHLVEYNGTFYSYVYGYHLGIPVIAGDGYFAKFNSDGELIYGSYYGGQYFDVIRSISVANDGRFVFAGETNSRTGIATNGTHQDSLSRQGQYNFSFIGIGFGFDCENGGWPLMDSCIVGQYWALPYDHRCQSSDAFLAMFDANGTRLWGTYYGDNLSEFNVRLSGNSSLDTISIGANTYGNYCMQWYPINDCPPARLANHYSYLNMPALYGAYTQIKAFIAQFDGTGNRILGTYMLDNKDIPDGNPDMQILTDLKQNNSEVIVSGYSLEFANYDYPLNSVLSRFAASALDSIVFPKYLNVCLGDTISLDVDVQSSINQEFLFTWYKNDSVIAHLNSATLSLPANFEDEGWYYYEIRAGNFKWIDSVYVSIREATAFNQTTKQGPYQSIDNHKILADINNDGYLDLVTQNHILYNYDLYINVVDSFPNQYPEFAPIDLFKSGKISLFTKQPSRVISGQTISYLRPSAIITIEQDFIHLIDTDLLNGVSVWADFFNQGRLSGFQMNQGSGMSANIFMVEVIEDSITRHPISINGNYNYTNCLQLASIGDYDNDGDIDILFTGSNISGCIWHSSVVIFRNDNPGFSIIHLPMIEYNRDMFAQWYDMDADGNLDIVFSKSINQNNWGSKVVQVYKYFEDTYSLFFSDTVQAGIYEGHLMFRPIVYDIDNDGYLDFIFGSQVFLNSGTGFLKVPSTSGMPFSGLNELILGRGDINNDGNIDAISNNGIFLNYPCNPPNTAPTAPNGLYTVVSNDTVRFYWQRATDLETPQMGLTYNMRVGTTPGGNDIMSSMSDSTGWRRIVGMGNVYQNTSWWLKLKGGEYYWSVQAIDNSFTGGAFAEEQSFIILSKPTIETPAIVYCEGDAITITALRDNAVYYPVNYKWYFNNEVLEGYNDSLIIINSLNNSMIGYYYCSISANEMIQYSDTIFISINQVQFMPGPVLPHYNNLVCDLNGNGLMDIFPSLTFDDRFNDVSLHLYDLNKSGAPDQIARQDSIRFYTYSDSVWTQFLHPIPDANLLRAADLYNNGSVQFVTHRMGYWDDLEIITMTDSGYSIQGLGHHLHYGTFDIIDIDNDMDFDIFTTGCLLQGWYQEKTSIFINNNDGFSRFDLDIPGIYYPNTSWGDFNNDGFIDLLISATGAYYPKFTRVYKNNNGLLDELVFDSSIHGEVNWVDIDNDGWLDIQIGQQIFRQQDGSFSLMDIVAFTGQLFDYDFDGDLDVLTKSGLNNQIFIFENCFPPNTPPTAPTNLQSNVTDGIVNFSWNPATDEQTPSPGLYYNLRVGTTPGGCDIVSPMSNPNGTRRIVRLGNVQQNLGWWLRDLAPATYYWSVQAIDNSFAGGPFAPEQTFTIPHLIPDNRVLENETITENQSVCFDAFETITVTNLLVQAGGNLELIAGASILILPETSVESGGIFRAWITSDSTFCTQQLSVVASEPEVKAPENEDAEIPISPFFHLFPNPTNSTFTLELTDESIINSITVEIYSMMGERLLQRELAGSRQYVFDLGSRPAGVYLVRVVKDGEMGMGKVVKQ